MWLSIFRIPMMPVLLEDTHFLENSATPLLQNCFTFCLLIYVIFVNICASGRKTWISEMEDRKLFFLNLVRARVFRN